MNLHPAFSFVPVNKYMITFEECRKLALAFPESTEEPHFEKPSFRYKGRIFMTFHTAKNQAMLILPELNQSILTSYNSEIIYPVTGFWGKQGATMFVLTKVTKKMFKDALKCAYQYTVEKKTVKKKLVKKVLKKK